VWDSSVFLHLLRLFFRLFLSSSMLCKPRECMVSIRFLAILISETPLVLFLPVSDSLVEFEFIDLSMAYVMLRVFS